jgi:hypothetical protein
MYLRHRTLVKNWDFTPPEERYEVTVRKGGALDTNIDPARVTYVVENMGYWYNADAIHGWFVDNVLDEMDWGQEACVTRAQLRALLSTVREVLADHSKAEVLLPTRDEYFFGVSEVDDFYFEELEETERILSSCDLEDEGDEYEYSYQGCW